MRKFCQICNRPGISCFCEQVRSFESSTEFALVVHSDEARSTVGTAWILRRSISNVHWVRSYGQTLDVHPGLIALLESPQYAPLLLFPGAQSFDLSTSSEIAWKELAPAPRKPLFLVIDGTWAQARQMLNRSTRLQALPRVSFETLRPSEYGFKRQPKPACLSSVEGVHRVIEVLAERGWAEPPRQREHDRMIEIFRKMVQFQLGQESVLRSVRWAALNAPADYSDNTRAAISRSSK